MSTLFPQLDPATQLVGIARLAAQGESIAEGHEVEYLRLQNRSLLTRCNSARMPFEWMINPFRGCEFACKYCYARYTHEFMELRDGADFERKIYVKQHVGWLLRQELRHVRTGQEIAIGTATDPYQPAERRFEITRSVLEEFSQHEGLRLSLVTKSNLILRDLELLQAISRRNRLSIMVTVTTLKAELARALEPRAPRPDLRLLAVRKLADAGIRVGVNCAPVLPQITDSPDDLENVVRASAQAGANFLFANSLFLKPCSAQVFLPFIRESFPHLVPLYEKRYAERAFAPAAYNRRILGLIGKYKAKYGITSERASSRNIDSDREQANRYSRAQMELFRE